MKSILMLLIIAYAKENVVVPFPSKEELASRPNSTTPLNATITDTEDAEACWLQSVSRGAPHLPKYCQPGYQRSGLWCYKPCPAGKKPRGPFCTRGLSASLRGFGRPLGCNQTWAERGGLFCYERCKAGFTGDGMFCKENCPPSKPFKCGMLCTRDRKDCSQEKLQLAMGGLGLVYGMGTLAISILAIIGTSGMASAIGGLGLAVGTLSLAQSSMSLTSQLIEYPFCYDRNNKTVMFKVIDGIKEKYENAMNGSCSALADRQNATLPESLSSQSNSTLSQ